jgi:hypothetical protein
VTVAPLSVEYDFQTGGSVKDRLPSVPDLDWEGFSSAYFPGSRRHNLKAIAAYGAYNRSLVAGEQQPSEPARLKADAHSIEAMALEEWEDEGGTSQ